MRVPIRQWGKRSFDNLRPSRHSPEARGQAMDEGGRSVHDAGPTDSPASQSESGQRGPRLLQPTFCGSPWNDERPPMPVPEAKRVLKAAENAPLATAVAFNFEDFRKQCDQYLQRVRNTARQIVQQAAQEAEQIKQQAYEKAKAEAYRDAMQQADAEIQRRAKALAEEQAAQSLQSMLPAIKDAADSILREYQEWLGRWEASAIRLSVAIAERLIARELRTRPEAATEMLAQALRLVSRVDRLTVRLNPDDLRALGESAEPFVRSIVHAERVELQAEASIPRGGCVIETRHGTVDARLETMLDRIVQELLQDPDDPS
ncbi:MAG TPA: hypothetical protein EYP14_06385 [Planctomycetaceae bacterium]|nr:hypothetical protein [Planctomycetaceae bacterium]